MPSPGKFEPEEIISLIKNAKRLSKAKYMTLAIEIVINTGIPVVDVVNLTIDDIHQKSLDQYYISLEFHTEPQEETKNQPRIEIPIEKMFFQRVLTTIKTRNAEFKLKGKPILPEFEKYLLLSNTGNILEPNQISHSFSNLLQRLFQPSEIQKRKLTWQSIRKTYGYYLLTVRNQPLHTVSHLLGHTSISQTVQFLSLPENNSLISKAGSKDPRAMDIIEELDGPFPTDVQEEELNATHSRIEQITEEILEYCGSNFFAMKNPTTRKEVIADLLEELQKLFLQIPTPRQLELERALKFVKHRYLSLVKDLRSAEHSGEEKKYSKLFDRKLERDIKKQAKDRCRELREQGYGYRKIADLINEEFNAHFHYTTIKYWLKKQE